MNTNRKTYTGKTFKIGGIVIREIQPVASPATPEPALAAALARIEALGNRQTRQSVIAADPQIKALSARQDQLSRYADGMSGGLAMFASLCPGSELQAVRTAIKDRIAELDREAMAERSGSGRAA